MLNKHDFCCILVRIIFCLMNRCKCTGRNTKTWHYTHSSKKQVSQLQNGVSTSSLPPFIVDLLTFKDYPRSNSFSMEILKGVKWQTSRAAYNGPKQQRIVSKGTLYLIPAAASITMSRNQRVNLLFIICRFQRFQTNYGELQPQMCSL